MMTSSSADVIISSVVSDADSASLDAWLAGLRLGDDVAGALRAAGANSIARMRSMGEEEVTRLVGEAGLPLGPKKVRVF